MTLLWQGNFSTSNFEGMTFGPTLADGSTSLLLISDNGSGIRQDLYALSVVPEPGAAVLLVAAAAAVCAARRTRFRPRSPVPPRNPVLPRSPVPPEPDQS